MILLEGIFLPKKPNRKEYIDTLKKKCTASKTLL